MSQQIQTARINGPTKTVADESVLATLGIHSPEDFPEGAQQAWEVLYNFYGEWKVSTILPAGFDAQYAVALGSAAVSAANDTITYADHRLFEGEQVKFTAINGTGLSTSTQYYVIIVDKDTIKVSADRDLVTPVDLGASTNNSFSITRFNWFNQDCASGKESVYVPIGAPMSTSDHTQPATEALRDFSFKIPPLYMLGGGSLYIKIEGSLYNDDADHQLFVTVDPDSNVYGDSLQGCDSGFIATVDTGSSATNCACTGHPFLDHQLVEAYPTSAPAGPTPSGLSLSAPYYISKIDADNFELCDDVALTSVVNFGGNGEFAVRRAPFGSKYATRSAFTIPVLNRRCPCTLEVWITNVGGQSVEANATENTNWRYRLTIPEYGLDVDPATDGGGIVFNHSHMRTRPSTAGSIETLRYSWGPYSRLWYFDPYPNFTYASGSTITGQTSGATGTVIDHDIKRKTITYRKVVPGVDFQAGETITDGSDTLAIAQCERGPLPANLGVRVAWEGPDNDPNFAEFIASQVTIAISRSRMM